jgi:hypothetical protein
MNGKKISKSSTQLKKLQIPTLKIQLQASTGGAGTVPLGVWNLKFP